MLDWSISNVFGHLADLDCICFPVTATRLLLGTEEREDSRLVVAEELLQPFSSHYANLHLYLFIFDTLLAEICPELVIRD